MQEFQIVLSSFQQVQNFVSVAVNQPFDIRVGNDRQHINGKDFMGMFSLDYSRPVRVSAYCSEDEFSLFRRELSKVLA